MAIITLLTISAMYFYESLSSDFLVLGVPSGWHDVAYVFILAFAYNIRDRRRVYHAVVCWFVAMLFFVPTAMQMIDFRPPGAVGKYDLLLDNLSIVFITAFGFIVDWLRRQGKIRYDKKLLFFYGIVALYVALNVLLVFRPTREMFGNYALIYDTMLYVFIYIVTLSSSSFFCNDTLHRSINYFTGMLHRMRLFICKVVKT
jgi:hypothetical protein